MKEVDYIVVGLGIAGTSFCERLERNGHSFVVIDLPRTSATATAGGVINPVVLKRFTPVWNVALFLKEAEPFYRNLMHKLEVPCFQEVFIDRILHDAGEVNTWHTVSDSTHLKPYLSSQIVSDNNSSVSAPNGFGRVLKAFRIDTVDFLSAYRNYLEVSGRLEAEVFDYDIQTETDGIVYGNYKTKRIVFAEGAAAINNPYFQLAEFIPKKGEYIIIKSPKANLEHILKGRFFVIPMGEDMYKVGATFAHGDTSAKITVKGKGQILEALDKILQVPYEVVDQMMGFRPTVKDRRPLLGSLEDERMLFFNGLGTRGLLMAPLLSEWLYNFAEKEEALPSEVNIQRFKKS